MAGTRTSHARQQGALRKLARLATATSAALLISSLAGTAEARNFTLQQDLRGSDFFDAFYWWNYRDPTSGAVEYVSQSTAKSAGLSWVNDRGHFVMQADNKTVISSFDRERQSVRLHSKKKMGDGILVARFHWMPQGCGTWPAFWTCTYRSWPAGGEIDIIEGANDEGPRNLASLHTLNGCTLPTGNSTLSTGTMNEGNCAYQPGCSTRFSQNNSFGPGFNQNGGGWYAMRRDTRATGDGIAIWFWPASTPVSSLPAAVAAGAGSAPKFVVTNANATGTDKKELDKWGEPAAFFPNSVNSTSAGSGMLVSQAESTCDMDNFFADHEIIINLTFCGYWAGETFMSSGCRSANRNLTCEQFVRENPAAFADARWEIEYLRTYTDAALGLTPPMLLALFATATTLLTLWAC